MSEIMTALTLICPKASSSGDGSEIFVEKPANDGKVFISMGSQSQRARVLVVDLQEAMSGLSASFTAAKILKAGARVILRRETLHALDQTLQDMRRCALEASFAEDCDRFEEVFDDGGGSAKKKKKKDSTEAAPDNSSTSNDQSTAGTPNKGKGKGASGSGGGKKPPGGGGRKFLGPYSPRNLKRKKKGNKGGKKAKKAKKAVTPPVASSGTDSDGEESLSAKSTPPTSPEHSPAVTSENSSDEDGPAKHPPKKRKRNRRRKKIPIQTTCVTDCECWGGGKDKTVKDFPLATTRTEQHHRQVIHQHLCHASLFAKLKSMSETNAELKETQESQGNMLKDVLQHVKFLSASKKFDEQRQKDVTTLQLKFTTMTQVLEALDEEEAAMTRTLTYCDQDDADDGAKFFSNYLKSIMETSLLYRMFPATENSEVTHSFILGQEYFHLPMKLQEMMFRYIIDKWPGNWRMSKCHRRLKSLLEYNRKTRSIQMRNLLTAKTKRPGCHELYFAIYWEWNQKLKVFNRPAPLWSDTSDASRDEYMELFEEKWAIAIDKKGITNWNEEPPEQNQKGEAEEQSKAQRSQVAVRASVEPYWEFRD